MSGLLADVRASSAADPRARCGIADFVKTLDEADRADLAVALADDLVKSAAIYRALKGRGLTLRYDAFRRHRAGGCSCPV